LAIEEPTTRLNNQTINQATKLETKLKILHLEDSPTDAELVERELKKGKLQFEKVVVGTKATFEKVLTEFAPDMVIADHSLPSFDSLEALRIIKQRGMKIPFILVSATVSDEYAVEVMKAGADDYVLKDRLHRLPQAILKAMEKKSAELKLHESETFNKGVLSSLSSHIAVIDQSGNLIAANKAWNDFGNENGITSLDLISTGSNYFDVCKRAVENGDSDAAQALAGIQSVFKEENQKFEMEYPCHSPDQQRWFLLNVMNFGSDAQKVVISHQDITERKLAEQSLLMSQSNLTALIENTDAMIYSLDTNFQYTIFNKQLHDTLKKNYNLDIKIGDDVHSFLGKLGPKEVEGYKEKYLQAFGGETVKFEKFKSEV
jgi:CheY-like chemotaxis protein